MPRGSNFISPFTTLFRGFEADEVKDRFVPEELQRGYKFKDRSLRPAMVTVASAGTD